jgi:hypothetical protein
MLGFHDYRGENSSHLPPQVTSHRGMGGRVHPVGHSWSSGEMAPLLIEYQPTGMASFRDRYEKVFVEPSFGGGQGASGAIM